jgi:hypothetical protein
MKLRRESAESGDCSGPQGEFNKVLCRVESCRDTFWSEIVFWTEKVPLSALAGAGFMKYAGLVTAWVTSVVLVRISVEK